MEYKKDTDGTDLLDENGNKIPVEITDDGSEADKKIKEAIAPLVEEIKGLKIANSMLKDMATNGGEKPDDKPKEAAELTEDEKIAAVVKKVLGAEKSSNAQANKKAAFEKFVAEHKEFHPENDSLGLKRDALQKKFSQFNTDGLSAVEDFMSVIGDAKTLLLGNDSTTETSERQPLIQQPPNLRNSPPKQTSSKLTDKEKKLMEQTGRTEEQILKMKQTHPDMLSDLLDFVRD